MSTFQHDGHRIAYTVRGEGTRPVVLVHGLLLSQTMHTGLAEALAERGHRVVTVDLLGHGRSARPRPTETYSIDSFGRQVVALLDHLDVDRAVIGGTSLGANVSLEVAARAPDRVQALVVDMPVLDNALLAAATVFTPLTYLLSNAGWLARILGFPARLVPEGMLPWLAEIPMEMLRQDPAAASRVLRGLLFGRAAPPHDERVRITAPAIVIGHPRDPIHPLSDADMLTRELPHGRLVRANSLVELRLRPKRLTAEIAGFLDECWAEPALRQAARRRTA